MHSFGDSSSGKLNPFFYILIGYKKIGKSFIILLYILIIFWFLFYLRVTRFQRNYILCNVHGDFLIPYYVYCTRSHIENFYYVGICWCFTIWDWQSHNKIFTLCTVTRRIINIVCSISNWYFSSYVSKYAVCEKSWAK